MDSTLFDDIMLNKKSEDKIYHMEYVFHTCVVFKFLKGRFQTPVITSNPWKHSECNCFLVLSMLVFYIILGLPVNHDWIGKNIVAVPHRYLVMTYIYTSDKV